MRGWSGIVLPLCLLGAGSALAAQQALGMLSRLQSGNWTIKSQDGAPLRTLCLTSGTQLVQLRHAGSTCDRYIVEDDADKVTVQYTCPRNGYGRTSIRKEPPTLVQIESQGIAGGLPFQFKAEARRTGPCKRPAAR